jgi:hypothetical protein
MTTLPRFSPRFFPLALLLAGAFADSLPGRAAADSAVRMTLIENDQQAVDAALGDKQPGPATQNVYSTQTATVTNIGYNAFTRNPNLWIGPKVDLTAISAYSDNVGSYGSKFAITAISPMHCLGAFHCRLQAGVHLNFVGADNATITRVVVASLNPVGDVEVYLLNQPLPPSVTPMSILPRDWAKYLHPGTPLHLPAIFINQNNRLYCAEAFGIASGSDPQVLYQAPTTSQRLAFNTQVISGDSSFPEMVLVNGTPAILSLWHFGDYGAGPLEAAHFDAINAAMRQLSRQGGLGTSYQLRPVSMKGIAKLL